MHSRFKFDPSVINSLVGGQSAVDIPRLNIKTLDQADLFLKTYGYDLSQPQKSERAWYFHRRAIVLLTEKLGYTDAEIPEVLRDAKSLKDIRQLLINASSTDPEQKEIQRWSCAILRTMHVYVHAETDLFSAFSEEIQRQILTPIQDCIFHEAKSTLLKAPNGNLDEIDLLGFEVKPFKNSASTVIKLLAKPDALAMKLFDKVGVRFITRSIFDSFRVIRFLVDQHIISFPHIMPDQSTNTIYPIELFLKVSEGFKAQPDLTDSELEEILQGELARAGDEVKFFKKENNYSGVEYRFIKFISRQLIQIKHEEDKHGFEFFYPYEIQVIDQASFQKVQSGPSEHQAYKERQILAARKRLFKSAEHEDTSR